jgi:hypothetical protein
MKENTLELDKTILKISVVVLDENPATLQLRVVA